MNVHKRTPTQHQHERKHEHKHNTNTSANTRALKHRGAVSVSFVLPMPKPACNACERMAFYKSNFCVLAPFSAPNTLKHVRILWFVRLNTPRGMWDGTGKSSNPFRAFNETLGVDLIGRQLCAEAYGLGSGYTGPHTVWAATEYATQQQTCRLSLFC
jgi:hypothetical protein